MELQLKSSLISQGQAQREYLALVQQEIPLLMQKAQMELRSAMATHDEGRIQQAQETIQQIRQMEQATTDLGNKWQTTLNTSMASALDQFTGKVLWSVKSIIAGLRADGARRGERARAHGDADARQRDDAEGDR